MLVFSHKIAFIENKVALGYLQLQSSVHLFDIAFAIKKFSFCGALFKCILT